MASCIWEVRHTLKNTHIFLGEDLLEEYRKASGLLMLIFNRVKFKVAKVSIVTENIRFNGKQYINISIALGYFLDLSEVFDTINHKTILSKLKYFTEIEAHLIIGSTVISLFDVKTHNSIRLYL